MRMRSAERRPETRRERPSEHGPSRYFPFAARSCVRCSDASCDENGRRRQEFCSPSAPSRATLARPGVRRAASRAIGQRVAVNRQRSSRRSLLGAPTVASERHLLVVTNTVPLEVASQIASQISFSCDISITFGRNAGLRRLTTQRPLVWSGPVNGLSGAHRSG